MLVGSDEKESNERLFKIRLCYVNRLQDLALEDVLVNGRCIIEELFGSSTLRIDCLIGKVLQNVLILLKGLD